MNKYIIYIEGAQNAFDLYETLADSGHIATINDSKVARNHYVIRFQCNVVDKEQCRAHIDDLIDTRGYWPMFYTLDTV